MGETEANLLRGRQMGRQWRIVQNGDNLIPPVGPLLGNVEQTLMNDTNITKFTVYIFHQKERVKQHFIFHIRYKKKLRQAPNTKNE